MPFLIAAAVAIVVVHSGIAHKEYRFIYPAVLLVMVLAGLGIGQLTEWGAEWLGRNGVKRHIASGVCAALLLGYSGILIFGVWTSAAVGSEPAMGDPGGGSDFAGFYNHLGIPILEWGFGGAGGFFGRDWEERKIREIIDKEGQK